MKFKSHVITEIFTYGVIDESIIFISFISIITSVLVITVKNPIVSVLFLIGLFLSISVYLISLGFFFIGLSYILVYIGAISILFIFILMLINIRVSELLSETKNSVPLVIIITIFLSTIIGEYIPENLSDFNSTIYSLKEFFTLILKYNINYILYVSFES